MKRLLLAAAAAAALAYARLVGGPMDGTVWDVKVKPDSWLAFSRRHTLLFSQGQLSAAGSIAEGFPPAVYRAEAANEDGGTLWTAALINPVKGLLSWQGLIRGDSIEGITILWPKDGKPQRFLFKGTRKPA